MTKTVGDIAINVTADIAPLTMAMKAGAESVSEMERQTKRAGARMQRFGSRVASLGKKMSVISGAMAAAGAAAFAIAKGTADAGVEIVNLSKVAGANTEEFQRMAAAAQSVGVEQDKLADILKDVNDKVGDFIETGGGPMADFFENIAPKVGVTAEQFKDLSGPDALQLYASSLQKANLSQSQMTFYMEALASDATALAPLLADNGAEMNRLGDAAQDAGAVLDGKALRASVRFKEEMLRMQQAFTGLKDRLGVALMPVITQFATMMTDKVVPALEVAIAKIGHMIEWFGNLPGPIQEAAGIIAGVFAVGGPILVGVGLVAKALGALVAASGPIGLFIAAAALAYAAWLKWGDDIKALFDRVATFVSEKFGKIREAATLSTEAMKQDFQAFSAWFENEYPRTFDVVSSVFEDLLAALKFHGDFMKAIFTNDWGAALSAIPEIFQQKFQEVFEFFAGLPDRFFEIGGQIVDGLKRGIQEKWESLKEMVLSLGDSLPMWMREKLGIQSPSRVFAEIGDFIGQGLARGVEASAGLVNQAVNVLGGSAVSGAEGTTQGVLAAMSQMFSGSKKISAGIALANSWLAFTEVLKDPTFVGRPWARVGAAFATLAPGLQAVQNIKSASSGGGGATSTGTTAAVAQAEPQRVAEVFIQGDYISSASVFEMLNQGADQGFQLRPGIVAQ